MESGPVPRKVEMSGGRWLERGAPLCTSVEMWDGEEGLEGMAWGPQRRDAFKNDPKETETDVALGQKCWVKPLVLTLVEEINDDKRSSGVRACCPATGSFS